MQLTNSSVSQNGEEKCEESKNFVQVEVPCYLTGMDSHQQAQEHSELQDVSLNGN